MKKPRDRLRVREIEIERLVVREPRGGRARAVVEAVPAGRGRASRVVLTLVAPDGEPVLVAEVSSRGEPRLSVGNPDRGPSVILTRHAVDAWDGGNIVAALRSSNGAGKLELADALGRPRVELPAEHRQRAEGQPSAARRRRPSTRA